VFLTGQSSKVTVQYQYELATAMITGAPDPAGVIDEVEVGERVANAECHVMVLRASSTPRSKVGHAESWYGVGRLEPQHGRRAPSNPVRSKQQSGSARAVLVPAAMLGALVTARSAALVDADKTRRGLVAEARRWRS